MVRPNIYVLMDSRSVPYFAFDTNIYCVEGNTCLFQGSSVTLGPLSSSYNLTIATYGSCQVTFVATNGPLIINSGVKIVADPLGNVSFVSRGSGSGITMGSSSRVEGSTITMRAETGSLSIAGTVTTDGTSSIFPQNPNTFEGFAAAWGGSYGGSGGRPADSIVALESSLIPAFTNILSEQGSADIFHSIHSNGLARGTCGYGIAGINKGQKGGGLIVLLGQSISVDGSISASGEDSPYQYETAAGAGSGGAIAIVTSSLAGSGTILARGGDSRSILCGAGGGGRISIRVPSGMNISQSGPVFSQSGRLDYILQPNSALTISVRGGFLPIMLRKI